MRRCSFTSHEDEASDKHYQRNDYCPFHLSVLKPLYLSSLNSRIGLAKYFEALFIDDVKQLQ